MYRFNPYRSLSLIPAKPQRNTIPNSGYVTSNYRGLRVPIDNSFINSYANGGNLFITGGYTDDDDDNTTIDTEFGYGEYDPIDPPIGLIADYTKKYGVRAAQKHFGIKPDKEAVAEGINDIDNDDNNITNRIYHFIDNNITFRPFRSLLSAAIQKKQALDNGITSAFNNFKNGNIGKGLITMGGIPMDIATSTITSPLMQYAPSYAMPFKDIPTTIYNRIARKITGDPSFTAIKGHTYSNLDYSPAFNDEAYRVVKSANEDPASDGGRAMINEDIKNQVDPNLSYGSSQLLLHPFNPAAGYAWTIGRVSPHSTSDMYYTNDTFDNNNAKTQYYLNKASLLHPTDWIRGIGGLVTSWDSEPDEGKQHTRLEFKKK